MWFLRASQVARGIFGRSINSEGIFSVGALQPGWTTPPPWAFPLPLPAVTPEDMIKDEAGLEGGTLPLIG